MNIFVLDADPLKAAMLQCDKHVVKMTLETAQIMCTVLHKYGHAARYRATHKKHPCTVWAGQSRGNWDWLTAHGIGLCEEYTHRYGRKHKSQEVIEECSQVFIPFPLEKQTPFALAMPTQYRSSDPVESYKLYYLSEKMGFATWKKNRPEWV